MRATAHDGRGATFHFTLPVQVTESSPLVARPTSSFRDIRISTAAGSEIQEIVWFIQLYALTRAFG